MLSRPSRTEDGASEAEKRILSQSSLASREGSRDTVLWGKESSRWIKPRVKPYFINKTHCCTVKLFDFCIILYSPLFYLLIFHCWLLNINIAQCCVSSELLGAQWRNTNIVNICRMRADRNGKKKDGGAAMHRRVQYNITSFRNNVFGTTFSKTKISYLSIYNLK